MKARLFTLCLFVISLCLTSLAEAQVARKLLPRNINVPGKDHFYPLLTADGREMIFLSTYSSTGVPTLRYSSMRSNGDWNVPEDVTGLLKGELEMLTGFGWSYDGQTMVMTSRRAPGIGGYDIWLSERRGDYSFGAPINLGKPVNSSANEGAPFLSADGKTMVFMRCDNMGNFKADGCSLYITSKQGGRWAEPVALPASVNKGNSQFPRLLADGNTLYFSSDQHGGKGGMELLMTRREGSTWSEPVLIDFLNDAEDNRFCSVPGSGDVVFYSSMYRDNKNIIMAKLPEEFQPDHVYLLKGTVSSTGAEEHPDCMVQVYDAESHELISGLRTDDDGSFFLIMPEGKKYDVSAFPLQLGHTFYADLFDLKDMEHSDWENHPINISPVNAGTSMVLQNIRFAPYDSTLLPESRLELLRLIKLMRGNTSLKVNIKGYITDYRQDSVQSDPDLNLAIYDTTWVESADTTESEETWNEYTAGEDTLATSFGDESMEEPALEPVVNTTWHNDRSGAYARAVMRFLIDQGVPENLLSAKGLQNRFSEDKSKEGLTYFVEVVFE